MGSLSIPKEIDPLTDDPHLHAEVDEQDSTSIPQESLFQATQTKLPLLLEQLQTTDSCLRHQVVKELLQWSHSSIAYELEDSSLESPLHFLLWYIDKIFDLLQIADPVSKSELIQTKSLCHWNLEQLSEQQTHLAAMCLFRGLLGGLYESRAEKSSYLFQEIQRIKKELFTRANNEPNFESLPNKELEAWIAAQTQRPEGDVSLTADEEDGMVLYGEVPPPTAIPPGSAHPESIPLGSVAWGTLEPEPEPLSEQYSEEVEDDLQYYQVELSLSLDDDELDLSSEETMVFGDELEPTERTRKTGKKARRAQEEEPVVQPAKAPREQRELPAVLPTEASPKPSQTQPPAPQQKQAPVDKWKEREKVEPEEVDAEQSETPTFQSIRIEEPVALEAPQRKTSGLLDLLLFPFKMILYIPAMLMMSLFVGLWKVLSGTYNLLRDIGTGVTNLFRDYWSNLRKRAKEEGVSTFELFLSDDAGRPGPFERMAAQSVTLLKGIQATIGLRFILFVNALDALVEMTVGYIAGIFLTWKMLLTARRRMERRSTPAHSLAEDVALSRIKLARLFTFVGFYTEEVKYQFPETDQQWEPALGETFPLKLVMDARGKLDDMKRDLAVITMHQALDNSKKSVKQFLLSWIPNPLNLLTAWKDIFVMFVFMKYSRKEVELMYMNLLDRYQQTLILMQERSLLDPNRTSPERLETYHQQLLEHETFLYQRLTMQRWSGEWSLEPTIEQNRKNLQRTLQLLCYPILMVDPKRWTKADLLLENAKMNEVTRFHPKFSIVLEEWLTQTVSKSLKTKGFTPNLDELQKQLQEANNWRHRKQTFQRVQKSWGYQL